MSRGRKPQRQGTVKIVTHKIIQHNPTLFSSFPGKDEMAPTRHHCHLMIPSKELAGLVLTQTSLPPARCSSSSVVASWRGNPDPMPIESPEHCVRGSRGWTLGGMDQNASCRCFREQQIFCLCNSSCFHFLG